MEKKFQPNVQHRRALAVRLRKQRLWKNKVLCVSTGKKNHMLENYNTTSIIIITEPVQTFGCQFKIYLCEQNQGQPCRQVDLNFSE